MSTPTPGSWIKSSPKPEKSAEPTTPPVKRLLGRKPHLTNRPLMENEGLRDLKNSLSQSTKKGKK